MDSSSSVSRELLKHENPNLLGLSTLFSSILIGEMGFTEEEILFGGISVYFFTGLCKDVFEGVWGVALVGDIFVNFTVGLK